MLGQEQGRFAKELQGLFDDPPGFVLDKETLKLDRRFHAFNSFRFYLRSLHIERTCDRMLVEGAFRCISGMSTIYMKQVGQKLHVTLRADRHGASCLLFQSFHMATISRVLLPLPQLPNVIVRKDHSRTCYTRRTKQVQVCTAAEPGNVQHDYPQN